jgi:hypothetical protein
MAGQEHRPGASDGTPPALPLEGYPISEEAVRRWFVETRGHEGTDVEIGAIMDAMARREATPPYEGPEASPDGWAAGLPGAPADRR